MHLPNKLVPLPSHTQGKNQSFLQPSRRQGGSLVTAVPIVLNSASLISLLGSCALPSTLAGLTRRNICYPQTPLIQGHGEEVTLSEGLKGWYITAWQIPVFKVCQPFSLTPHPNKDSALAMSS